MMQQPHPSIRRTATRGVRRRSASALTAVVLAGTLLGCSGDDDASPSATTDPFVSAPLTDPLTEPSVAPSTPPANPSAPTTLAAAAEAPETVEEVLVSAGAEPGIAGCYELVLTRSGVAAPDNLIEMREAFAGLDEIAQLALADCVKQINN